MQNVFIAYTKFDCPDFGYLSTTLSFVWPLAE